MIILLGKGHETYVEIEGVKNIISPNMKWYGKSQKISVPAGEKWSI